MKIVVYLFLFALLFSQESFAGHANPEDVAVLTAAIRQDCAARGGEYVVLSSETFPVAEADVMSGNLDVDAKNDLLKRNVSASPLPMDMACRAVRIVQESTIEKLLKDRPTMLGLSKGFYEAFPGADTVIFLSLPGYAKNENDAIVHISYACGTSCGTSFIVHLQKSNGSWHVVKTSNSWMS
jgi:hypothetical protein